MTTTLIAMLTVEEVAENLRVSKQTVRRMIRRGELQGIQVGERRYSIPAAELARYLRERAELEQSGRGCRSFSVIHLVRPRRG